MVPKKFGRLSCKFFKSGIFTFGNDGLKFYRISLLMNITEIVNISIIYGKKSNFW